MYLLCCLANQTESIHCSLVYVLEATPGPWAYEIRITKGLYCGGKVIHPSIT